MIGLFEWQRRFLSRRLARLRCRREPDQVIGGAENPYMRRWYLIPRNRWFNIYHHEVLRSDDDRALHDHPWINLSIVVDGYVYEALPKDSEDPAGASKIVKLSQGAMKLRGPASAHRLVLPPGLVYRSLFITGPRVREWGFWCQNGWRHWKDFTGFKTSGDSNVVGPGCD